MPIINSAASSGRIPGAASFLQQINRQQQEQQKAEALRPEAPQLANNSQQATSHRPAVERQPRVEAPQLANNSQQAISHRPAVEQKPVVEALQAFQSQATLSSMAHHVDVTVPSSANSANRPSVNTPPSGAGRALSRSLDILA